jgi:hypothetical protein
MLAASARQRARERCKEKGLLRSPVPLSFKVLYLVGKLKLHEAGHAQELCEVAKEAVSRVWGISTQRLSASLTTNVAFGNLSKPRSVRGAILRTAVVSYGGVMPGRDALEVVAKGPNFFLLSKELVKGTAELICLHGLNTLDDDTYQHVIYRADRIEWEPWMLQTGGELWRRLLTVVPHGTPLAELLMHLARLSPSVLESVMLAVIEQPDRAQRRMAAMFN